MLNPDYDNIPPVKRMDLNDLSVTLVSHSRKQVDTDLAWLDARFDNVAEAAVSSLFLRPSDKADVNFLDELLLFCGKRECDLVVFAEAILLEHSAFHAILMRAAALSHGRVVLPMTLNTINDMNLAGLPWQSPVFSHAHIGQYPGLDSCFIEFEESQPPAVPLLDWYLAEGRSLRPRIHGLVMEALRALTSLDRTLHALEPDVFNNPRTLVCNTPQTLLATLGLKADKWPSLTVEAGPEATVGQGLRESMEAFGFTWHENSCEKQACTEPPIALLPPPTHAANSPGEKVALYLNDDRFLIEAMPLAAVQQDRAPHLYHPGLDLPEEETERLVQVEALERTSINTLANHFDDPKQLYAALRPFSGHWQKGWRKLINWLRTHGYSFKHQHRLEPGNHEKVACIRYDVHVRDIAGAWGMLGLNEELGVEAEYHLLWGHGLYETMNEDSFSALAAHESDLAAFGLHASLLDHHLTWQFFDGHEGNYARALDGERSDEFISLLADPAQLQSIEKRAKQRFTGLYASFEEKCASCRCFSYHGSYINWLLWKRHWKEFDLNKLVLSLHGERLLQEAIDETCKGLESDHSARVLGLEYVSDNMESESLTLNRLFDVVSKGSSFVLLVHPALLQRGCTSFINLPTLA